MTLFSPLELIVIHIGERDSLASATGGGRLARLLTMLIGRAPPPPPLADRRLEALRRLVIALRHNHRNRDRVIAAALDAGITRAQIDCLANDLHAPVPSEIVPEAIPLTPLSVRKHLASQDVAFADGFGGNRSFFERAAGLRR